MKYLLVFLLFQNAGGVLAHSTGHGPAIEGTGPHQGKLTSIVLAKDAELGEKATASGVAEWTMKDGTMNVYLLNVDRKTPMAFQSEVPFKWILIPKDSKKKAAVLQSKDLVMLVAKDIKTVEVILPEVKSTPKQVLIINL